MAGIDATEGTNLFVNSDGCGFLLSPLKDKRFSLRRRDLNRRPFSLLLATLT
jgi:hypothetical protein